MTRRIVLALASQDAFAWVRCSAIAIAWALPGAAFASPFATRVMSFNPAPGQFAQDPSFNDPTRALGPPIGGALVSPDNTKLVSLGGFGGSITLGFDHTIANLPSTATNPRGLDFIVFGNAFYLGSSGEYAMAEAGVVEVSLDANHNGLADDAWYLIPGSALAAGPFPVAKFTKTWDDNIADGNHPPSSSAWVPPGSSGTWTTSGYRLVAAGFTPPVWMGTPGTGESAATWGYADCAPTLALGDLDGDGEVDDPSLTPEQFYTRASDPIVRPPGGVAPGAGGGDGFDIAWAINPVTGAPAGLTGFDFVRISTAVDLVRPFLGEVSAEIGGVAEVVPAAARSICDIADDAGNPLPSPAPNSGVNEGDFNAFFQGFFSAAVHCDIADDSGQPLPSSGVNSGVNEGDYNAFFQHFFD